MKKRAWLVGGGLLLLCAVGWVALHARTAVVTVRFEPRRSDAAIDYLFVTVGATKQSAEGLRRGQEERFVFSPEAGEPLSLGYWMGTYNGGWEGPVLRPRHRLDITLDAEGVVSWHECEWPCW